MSVGWFEFIVDHQATTHIAYVYEDGSVYLPEGFDVVTELDFTLASARGRSWHLVRAAEDDVVIPAAVAKAYLAAWGTRPAAPACAAIYDAIEEQLP